jgi:DGQHR domain-containing protein
MIKNKLNSKSSNLFIDDEDFAGGINWMLDFLYEELEDAHKHEDPETVADEIYELIDEIKSVRFNKGEDFSSIWGTILKIHQETYHHQKTPEIIYWGVWRINLKQKLKFGYLEGYLDSAQVIPGGNIKLHQYKAIPPNIIWELHPITQKGLTFYIANAQVHEIEQVCSVPSLPDSISIKEVGLRILDTQRAPHEWQRKPNPKRIESIKEFVEINNNLIANAPILFLNESPALNLSKNKLEIDFSKFLLTKKKEYDTKVIWQDFENYSSDENGMLNDNCLKDLRPIWLIDGQHRVRGLSRSKTGGKLSIPIILFPSDFGLPMAAKIFAEINTLQESLKPLHKLFMQHRFKISSPISNRNFENWEANPNQFKDSRANNMSYELIAKLASRDNSALFDKVKLLDQNEGDFYIKADQWVNYSRNWFIHGPYESFLTWPLERHDDIYEEVNNYFQAFIRTVNHNGWRDKKDRWTNTTRNKSILQSSTHFKVLVDLYSEVHVRAKVGKAIITIDAFMKILAPFKWVDWTSKELKSTFGGGGEKGRTSLYIWMYDALKTKESHRLKEVMSSSIKSIPGKGILAPPDKPKLSINHEWPTKSKPVTFYSERPINARRKPEWIIMDNYEETYNILKIKSNGEAELSYFEGIEKIRFFKVTVQWGNAASSNATNTLKINNPSK